MTADDNSHIGIRGSRALKAESTVRIGQTGLQGYLELMHSTMTRSPEPHPDA
jgi:hypothetical protein